MKLFCVKIGFPESFDNIIECIYVFHWYIWPFKFLQNLINFDNNISLWSSYNNKCVFDSCCWLILHTGIGTRITLNEPKAYLT